MIANGSVRNYQSWWSSWKINGNQRGMLRKELLFCLVHQWSKMLGKRLFNGRDCQKYCFQRSPCFDF
eukprot:UN02653